MTSSSATSNVFAISTTFSPPATCTGQFTIMEKLQYRIYLDYPDPAVSGTTVTDCYPSQFISSYLSQEAATTPLPAIQPLVCPIGYSQVTTNTAGYLACCPSGFSLAPPTTSSIFTRPAYGGTCYTDISTVLVTAYDNTSVTATSTWVASSAGAQAYALPIEGFAAAVTTSSSSSTSSSVSSSTLVAAMTSNEPAAASTTASATSTPTPSHHSHTGAIVGGVIGGVAGLLLILGLIWFLLRRKRSKQVPPAVEKSELSDTHDSEISVKREYKSAGPAEIGSTRMSWLPEKDGTGTPVGAVAEMDGRTSVSRGMSELDSQASNVVK